MTNRIIISFTIFIISMIYISSAIASSKPSIEFLQSFSDAWNDHNLDSLLTFMSSEKDVVFHAVAGPDLQGKSYVGLEDIRIGFSQAFINFPDAKWVDPIHFISSDGHHGITESTFIGTKTTPDGTFRIEARMVDVFTFDINGKIKSKNAFRKDRPAIPVVENQEL